MVEVEQISTLCVHFLLSSFDTITHYGTTVKSQSWEMNPRLEMKRSSRIFDMCECE